MDHSQLNWIATFMWSIADNVLRDVHVRGKYCDVILPMVVNADRAAAGHPRTGGGLGPGLYPTGRPIEERHDVRLSSKRGRNHSR